MITYTQIFKEKRIKKRERKIPKPNLEVVIFIKDLKFKFKKNQKFNLLINKKDKK